jgi:hypothetical protein
VAAWHAKRTEIEATHEYNDAKSKIDQAVSLQKSMAAKHRVLVSAGLSDRSLPSFRKHPTYVISASRVAEACKRLGFPSQALDDMTAELEVHWQQGRFDPPAIATGIKGLEK